MPSSIGVLWTQPVPLWISANDELGWAPHGGVPNANRYPDQAFTQTEPYRRLPIARSTEPASTVSFIVRGWTTRPAESVPQSRLLAKVTAFSRKSIGSLLPI